MFLLCIRPFSHGRRRRAFRHWLVEGVAEGSVEKQDDGHGQTFSLDVLQASTVLLFDAGLLELHRITMSVVLLIDNSPCDNDGASHTYVVSLLVSMASVVCFFSLAFGTCGTAECR